MAKGEQNGEFLFIVVTVTHKNAFSVIHLVFLAGEIQIRRVILQTQGKRLGKSAAWIRFSK